VIAEPDTNGLFRELATIRLHYAEQARLADERAERQSRRAERAERTLKAMQGAPERLVAAALAFLECIDEISAIDFSYGAERQTREALRSALVDLGATTPRPDTWEWDRHMAELKQAEADAVPLGDEA
jgi:hypothetical protein